MVNFGPLAAEIVSLVWGTPGNFNGFRVLAALVHGTLVVGVSQTAAFNRGRHLYSAGRPSRWALAHISSLKNVFIPSFWELAYTDQTGQRIFTLDGSNDANSRKDVPFGGLVHIAAHLVICPKNPFWDVNRRFPATYAKCSNFHILETAASIATTFCTVIRPPSGYFTIGNLNF